MMANWLDLLSAALSGGVIVKVLDHAYSEYRRRSEARKSASDVLNKHLDPILKSTDELVGKIRSLAQTDFREIIHSKDEEATNIESTMPLFEILFLFSQFWARIQILRLESEYINISSEKNGKRLLEFLRALEATRTRLIDRAWQRGIGEAIIEYRENGVRSLNYFEFVEKYKASKEFQEWFKPIITIFKRINHTRIKQRFLAYGTILHALIDTLDSKHLVARDRPGWVNKLSTKTRRELQHRIFKVYLPFVNNAEIYYKISR